MSIYTRFGTPVIITDYIGEDTGRTAFGEQTQGVWVTVCFQAMDSYLDLRDVLVSDLRADNGYAEILEAIERVRPVEADGTSEYMVENIYNALPGDDWLAIANIRRQFRYGGQFLAVNEYGWAGGLLICQGRYDEAAQERAAYRRLQAALIADPGLRAALAIHDAKLNFSMCTREDFRRAYGASLTGG